MGEHEPFNVLRWLYKGLLSGSHGPKIGQNCMKYDIFGNFRQFPLQKSKKRMQLLILLIFDDFMGKYEPLDVMYFIRSI